METDLKKHTDHYAQVYAHELDLNPKHPIFPPDYLEDEKHIYLNPVATYIRATIGEYTHVFVDVTEGNAPLQVNFLFDNGDMQKEFVWIGDQVSIKIPYREDGVCQVYFLRKLNKGFCKGSYRFEKQ